MMNRNVKLLFSTLLIWFLLALPAQAVLDGAVCSSADIPGGTSCNATQLKTYINEEDQGLDDRAPLEAFSVTGTDAYTATVTPAITAYDPEMSAWVKVPNTNTGAVTIRFNSLAFKPVVSAAGSALGAGDMRSDTLYLIKRYATNDEFRIVTQLGAGAAAASNAYVTIGNSGALTNERALTAGTGLGLTDGGVNSTVTLNITDAELACILAQTSAADKISYWTGSGTCALADFSSAFRTYLTTASVANLAAVLTDEASGWATFQATPSMANLSSFLTDDAAGFTTFGTTPSMANLGTLLTDEASGWITFGTTPTSANARALYTDEIGTGVLFFLGAPASDDQVFVSTSTSAGAWGTLPDSDAATQKLQYDQTTNVFSAGTDDDIPDAGDFTNLALSGDVVSSALVTTIQANAVALGTDTTGNYALGDAEGGAATTGDSATAFFSAGTIEDARIDGSAEADEVNPTLGSQTQGNYQTGNTAGAGIAVTQTPAEGFSATIAFDYSDQGASPSLAADACQFTSNATTSGFIVCEGDTADAFETRIFVTDPTADRLVTVPNADSNTIQPLTCGGSDKVSAISALGVVTCTADAGAGGGISNVVEDLTPELGGALDTNGKNIEFGTAQTDTSVVRSSAGHISVEGKVVYMAGDTDVALADGGTGASLSDPNADKFMFWDDSAGAVDWLTMGTAYTTNGTTLNSPKENICAKISDEATAITTGSKVKILMPYALTVTGVSAYLTVVSSSGNPAFNIKEDPDAEGGTASASILSTTITIDANERRSSTAATPAVVSDTSLAANSEIEFIIDTAGTGAKGAEICIIGYQT